MNKPMKVADELAAMDAERIGPQVYRAIAEVQGELAQVGIAKTRRNTQGSGYNFRGIDDVYAALSPLLAKHKLVVVPRMTHREVIERQSKSGGALFYVTVHAEFDFVSAIDGTTHTAATFGEAMDSGDKATNKAMSAAYKYAAFMTFAIPTEGDNDTENVTHEVAANPSTGETPPAKRVELAGPYTCKTQLQAAAKQFVLTLERMSDLDDFIAWQQTSEVVDFCVQLERDMPDWWRGGPSVPAEFVPLEIRIAQKKLDLEQIASLKERA
jgi:hypothetical protein